MKNLRIIRKQNKLSQKVLGEKLHVSTTAISNYETGANFPDMAVLRAMAEYFDVSLEYLLDLTSVPYPIPKADQYLLDKPMVRLVEALYSLPEEDRKPLIKVIENYTLWKK